MEREKEMPGLDERVGEVVDRAAPRHGVNLSDNSLRQEIVREVLDWLEGVDVPNDEVGDYMIKVRVQALLRKAGENQSLRSFARSHRRMAKVAMSHMS